jgi:two-component system, NarL family, sensor histidine kinase UhpB
MDLSSAYEANHGHRDRARIKGVSCSLQRADDEDSDQDRGEPRLSEQRYQALVEHIPAICYTARLDSTTKSHYISPQARKILGYSPNELVADPNLWMRRIHPDDRGRVLAEYERCRSIGTPFTIEYRFYRGDGRLIWLLDEAEFVVGRDGKPALIQGVMFDITERKRNEELLKESAEQHARLLEQLISSQESERRRIQMDIHDGPLQSLGVSLMALDRAMRRRERGEDAMADQELRHLREMLTETIGEMRGVLADLSQEVLQTKGLVPALRRYLSRFHELTGIQTYFDTNLGRRIAPDYELLLYRLVQESLSNVRKHASARSVLVALVERGGTLHLTVRDDGQGFNVDEVLKLTRMDGDMLGLRSMRQRARAAGGDLHIFSAPGTGTALHFSCPLRASG